MTLRATIPARITRLILFAIVCTSADINRAAAQSPTTEELRTLGLPVVEIATVDGEEPTCDVVYPPAGGMGTGIANATKVPGRVRIYDAQGVVFDSGEYLQDVSGMTVKIRGNSSGANEIKRPYKIKLQKKADMLRRGDEARYRDKNWALLRSDEMRAEPDTADSTAAGRRWVTEKFINPIVGLKTNELLGLQWTPQMQFVNLVFNGDYRGIYMLSETMERNADCRIDVDRESGYIFEYDAYWWNEDVYFESATGNKFTFKYPDAEAITPGSIDYIRATVDTLEARIETGGYAEVMDVESFAAWMLAHDILGTLDGAGSNIFVTKRDDTPASKLMMGNLWDFDTIMQHAAGWGSIRYTPDFWFARLFQSPDPTFALAYKQLWEERGANCIRQIREHVEAFAASATAAALEASTPFDAERWNRLPGKVQSEAERAQTWFEMREPWLNDAIPAIPAAIASPPLKTASVLHDLQGRRLARPPYKGVYIRDGQKLLAH